MTKLTHYKDFGNNIEVVYVDGILREAIKLPNANDEAYYKLVCSLKFHETDFDEVLFKLVATRFVPKAKVQQITVNIGFADPAESEYNKRFTVTQKIMSTAGLVLVLVILPTYLASGIIQLLMRL